MSNCLSSPDSPRPMRRAGGPLLRLIVDRNPFFLLSAVSMFAGVRVILAALNLYEALVIGLALFLITRRDQRRDGWILLSIEALFLVDLTLLNSELFTANLRWGTAINAACWML